MTTRLTKIRVAAFYANLGIPIRQADNERIQDFADTSHRPVTSGALGDVCLSVLRRALMVHADGTDIRIEIRFE